MASVLHGDVGCGKPMDNCKGLAYLPLEQSSTIYIHIYIYIWDSFKGRFKEADRATHCAAASPLGTLLRAG